MAKLIEDVAAELGIARKPIPAGSIQRRIRAAMVNEGAKILAEGIAARALDIDMALIHGFGYPRTAPGQCRRGEDDPMMRR